MSDSLKIHQDAVSTRNKARSISEEVTDGGHESLDLSNVEFISRSVADEFVQQSQSKDFDLVGAEDDVADMIEIVKRGRQAAP